jgi:hypothetical protein
VLEVAPWNGEPLYPKTSESVLTWQFGPHQEGLAYYLVIEHVFLMTFVAFVGC